MVPLQGKASGPSDGCEIVEVKEKEGYRNLEGSGLFLVLSQVLKALAFSVIKSILF